MKKSVSSLVHWRNRIAFCSIRCCPSQPTAASLEAGLGKRSPGHFFKEDWSPFWQFYPKDSDGQWHFYIRFLRGEPRKRLLSSCPIPYWCAAYGAPQMFSQMLLEVRASLPVLLELVESSLTQGRAYWQRATWQLAASQDICSASWATSDMFLLVLQGPESVLPFSRWVADV